MNKPVVTTIAAVSLFSAGFISGQYFHPDTVSLPPKPFTESRLQGSYKFINPLLECDIDAVSTDTNLDKLRNSIQEYINGEIVKGNITHTSVYYRDMNNGPWFGIGQNEMFSPASLIKVPLMIAYFKLSETDPAILDKEIVVTPPPNVLPQNITPTVTLVPNQKYTIRQLLNHLIVFSDNEAYNILLANIDNQFLIKVFNDLGVDITPGLNNPNGDIISVKSYASFFRILYNASYLTPKSSEEALSILSQTKFKDALVAGLPSSVLSAHKYGERSFENSPVKQLHDCGIVYAPGKPYLICIMTRGTDFGKLTATIKKISSTIYTGVSQK
jgi:beta-lactamase class A